MAAYTAIDDPEAYFQVHLYTGDGAANNAITLGADTDMQPDLVWIKNRSAADGHCLFDAVRGATKLLDSTGTAAETTDTDTLDSFTSDGFQVDADDKVNTNTENYVSWNWKESATSGFDIVAYTGTGSAKTESHSLSAVPHLIIVKTRTDVDAWRVYHHKNTSADPAEQQILQLDNTSATEAETAWNNTAPTSSVFSLGAVDPTNEDTDSYIAYLWSEKQGFSKFGSYIGNGNADGSFVYTGFRPAWLLIKASSISGENWMMYDNKRSPINVIEDYLVASTTHAERSDSVFAIDFLSNGFKIRATQSGINTSGATYVYMAFAEAPFVNSNGVPCNAR
jgi:hypothetical protein